MIEEILPRAVAVAEAFADSDAPLFPEEEAIVSSAVEKRRKEFATGRACAREALGRLGLPPGPIPSGERGEPVWPPGTIGSITHCDGYRACAVAKAVDVLSLGIDAEPHHPLPDGLVNDIARPEELPRLAQLSRAEPAVHWDRLTFCAKESVYKAWYPLAQRWLGFEEAALILDASRRTFSARLLAPGPYVSGKRLSGFTGRWLVRDGIVMTAIAVKNTRPPTG